MPKQAGPELQRFAAAEYCSEDAGRPEKLDLWDGVIGPYSDAGNLSLFANWGADEIVRLTGPDIWRETLAAIDATK
ncbi:MAG: hypothetical protein NW217_15985 [Hyphomicrobiaceae bacterium]|nr:hypothetical protein [Hyphomicrobiaceae bacterium]